MMADRPPRLRATASARDALAMLRRALLTLWIYALPLIAPWALLVAVNVTDPAVPFARTRVPREPRRPDRCTWACHNRGCTHRPRLPAVFTSDRYLFGWTIRALYGVGHAFSRDRFVGYGVANLVVLCAAWPALMYGLWVVVWRQRETLRALRAAGGGAR